MVMQTFRHVLDNLGVAGSAGLCPFKAWGGLANASCTANTSAMKQSSIKKTTILLRIKPPFFGKISFLNELTNDAHKTRWPTYFGPLQILELYLFSYMKGWMSIKIALRLLSGRQPDFTSIKYWLTTTAISYPYCSGKIKGNMICEGNCSHKWFDGTIERYLAGDKIDPKQVAKLTCVNGNRNDNKSKIYLFKITRGNQAYDTGDPQNPKNRQERDNPFAPVTAKLLFPELITTVAPIMNPLTRKHNRLSLFCPRPDRQASLTSKRPSGEAAMPG